MSFSCLLVEVLFLFDLGVRKLERLFNSFLSFYLFIYFARSIELISYFKFLSFFSNFYSWIAVIFFFFIIRKTRIRMEFRLLRWEKENSSHKTKSWIGCERPVFYLQIIKHAIRYRLSKSTRIDVCVIITTNNVTLRSWIS